MKIKNASQVPAQIPSTETEPPNQTSEGVAVDGQISETEVKLLMGFERTQLMTQQALLQKTSISSGHAVQSLAQARLELDDYYSQPNSINDFYSVASEMLGNACDDPKSYVQNQIAEYISTQLSTADEPKEKDKFMELFILVHPEYYDKSLRDIAYSISNSSKID